MSIEFLNFLSFGFVNIWFVANLTTFLFWINPTVECLATRFPISSGEYLDPFPQNEKINASFLIEPLLTGPDRFCLIFGSVFGNFSGLEDPETDVYNFIVGVPFCQWDGIVNGKKVPSGTYIVTLLYRSERFGIKEKVSKSLLILD